MKLSTTFLSNQKKQWLLLTSLFLLIFSLAACGQTVAANQSPQAVDGVLDLRRWNFEQNGVVTLNGKWEFYWEQLLTANAANDLADALPTGLIAVPGSWRGYQVNGQPLGGDGYATYRLTVLLNPTALPVDPTDDSLGLKLPVPLNTAHELYVNGQKVGAVGQVGPSAQTMTPQYAPYVTVFPVGSEGTGRLEILLQISNFYHYQGGIIEPILLGTHDQMHQLQQQELGRDLFLVGSIFIMGLYHLGLFSLRRKDKSTLYFGLFCLLVAAVTLIARQPPVFAHYVSASWTLFFRVGFLLAFSIIVPIILFTHTLFPREASRPAFRFFGGMALLFAGLMLLAPIKMVTVAQVPITVFVAIATLYTLGVALLAAIHQRNGARIFLLGYTPLLVTIINDIMVFNGWLQTGRLISVGLFIFIFAQAYLLSVRFSNAFHQTETLTSELRRSEEKYRTIFEESKDVIFITTPAGRIEEVNPASFELLGYTRTEALAMNALDFYADPVERDRFQRLMAQQGEVTDFVLQMRHKDGRAIDCQVTATLRRDTAGQVIGYQGIIHDITATRLAAAERERALTLQKDKDAADIANRAKSAFLAKMSHELRTPLNAIIGFGRLLVRSPNLNPTERENMQVITGSGQHLLALINQVLDLSKIEAGRMTFNRSRLNLPDLLAELEGMFRLQATEKGLRLLIDYAPDVPAHIYTDALKLRQVLINLLNNAFKFTKNGGVALKIRLKAESEKVNQEIPLQPSVFSLHISVIDTGPGILPADRNKLFEAFEQTSVGRQATEGTGLGLPISRKLIDLMGGSLSVESPLTESMTFGPQGGPGACFQFTLPVEPASTRQQDATPESHLALVGSELKVVGLAAGQPRHRLLIVDDKANNRELLLQLFQPLDFVLHQAENGRQAVEIWQKFRPDLILMDMQMPLLDGYEATKEIRRLANRQADEASPDEPGNPIIIALTASSFVQDKARILAAGCDDFLSKPFLEADLFTMINKHLGLSFIYQGDDPAPARPDAEALAQLPSARRQQLVDAVKLADIQHIETLLAEIDADWPQAAQAIKPLLDEFKYDELLAVLTTNK